MQAVPPVAPVTPAPGNVPQDEAGGQGWQGQGSKGGGQVGFLPPAIVQKHSLTGEKKR